ncbi:hypothetical protein [Burkholderia sp. Ax-1719]|jgi:hypothetical protein|uniref:hypothetical protein n=1 Tax=Burkholderia sp. Ax-1719 TaxID=2608334 RepID=UPI00141F2994|nr:hypothetical protein [Burkholderia sp. Ax-1719]NIE65395.1 hypothetical protein [Burkholderia sp. Ax-1719]
MRFEKRGAIVDAQRWLAASAHPRVERDAERWVIATPEGWREVNDGDWIVTDETGNAWPMNDHLFRSLYVPAGE